MCGQRLGSGVFRLQGTKVAYAVPLLLVLAVVLVAALAFNVANLDPGGESIPQAPAAGGPPPTESYLPDPIVTQVLAVLFGFIMLGGAILFFRNRTRVRAPAKRFTWWQVLARALGVAVLVVVLLAWPRAIQAARERAGTQANATAEGGTLTTVWPAAVAGPIEIFLLVAVFLAVAWLAYLFRRARMQGDATDWEDTFPVSAARVVAATTVREAILEIEGGGEVRPRAFLSRMDGPSASRGRSSWSISATFMIVAAAVVLGLLLYYAQYSGSVQWGLGLVFLGVIAFLAWRQVLRGTAEPGPLVGPVSPETIRTGELDALSGSMQRAARGLRYSQMLVTSRARVAFLEHVRLTLGLSPEGLRRLQRDPEALRRTVGDERLAEFLHIRVGDMEERFGWVLQARARGGFTREFREVLSRMEAWR